MRSPQQAAIALLLHAGRPAGALGWCMGSAITSPLVTCDLKVLGIRRAGAQPVQRRGSVLVAAVCVSTRLEQCIDHWSAPHLHSLHAGVKTTAASV
jgi:hypothetical protein